MTEQVRGPVSHAGARGSAGGQISRQDVEATISSSLALIDGLGGADSVAVPVKHLSVLVTAAKRFVEKDPTVLRRHFRK